MTRHIAFFAALLALCFGLAAKARAEVDCAQCQALCTKGGAVRPYPDDLQPEQMSQEVRHQDPEARAHFVEAQRRDPAFGGKDPTGAVAAYKAALRIDPDNAQYRNYLAGALMRVGRVREAIYNLQQAVRIVPNQPKYLVNLGYAYHKADDETRALVSYLRALMLDPRDVRARLFAGYAMELLGLTDDAVLEFRRVLAQEPAHDKARRALARLEPAARGGRATD